MSRVDPRDPAIQNALDEVKNDKSDTVWLLTTYEPRSVRLRLVGSGSGGWDEMCDELSDGKVFFGFCRFTIKEIYRYAYLSWCGEGVQGMQAGQFNNHALDMQRFFQGYHVHINARNDGDIEESDVIARLNKGVGAQYDAGQVIQGVQGNSGGGPKQTVKTDAGTIDQEASSQYWAQQRAEESSPASGYKKDMSFQAGGNAGNLKSRFEQLAEAQRPDAGPSGSTPAPVQLDLAQGSSEIESTPAASEITYDQGGYEEATYDQGSYDQGGYDEGASYDAGASYEQDQGGYEEGGYEEGGYEEGGYEEGGYEEGGYDEGSYGGEIYATALYDYAGEAEGDLAFSAGDKILIVDQSDPSGWWCGRLGDVEGYFPSNFVQAD